MIRVAIFSCTCAIIPQKQVYTMSIRPITWIVWCVFSRFSLSMYLFLSENGPGIPFFGYCLCFLLSDGIHDE